MFGRRRQSGLILQSADALAAKCSSDAPESNPCGERNATGTRPTIAGALHKINAAEAIARAHRHTHTRPERETGALIFPLEDSATELRCANAACSFCLLSYPGRSEWQEIRCACSSSEQRAMEGVSMKSAIVDQAGRENR